MTPIVSKDQHLFWVKLSIVGVIDYEKRMLMKLSLTLKVYCNCVFSTVFMSQICLTWVSSAIHLSYNTSLLVEITGTILGGITI